MLVVGLVAPRAVGALELVADEEEGVGQAVGRAMGALGWRGVAVERALEVGAAAGVVALEGDDGLVVGRALGGGRLEAGAWLGAVALEESRLAVEVERCERLGDGGHSVGLWQVWRPSSASRAAMCAGGRAGLEAQARAGLERSAQCARGGARGAMGLARCYVGGRDGGRRAGTWARVVRLARGGR